MPRFLTILILVIFFTACKKSADNDQDEDTSVALTLMNESYGSFPRYKFDAYLPAGRNLSTTNSVIFIHGGSWVAGDKSELNGYINEIKRRLPENAYFNINYRYAINAEDRFPAQELDIKAAVDYIISHKETYQITGNYIIAGFSSGGQLALLQAYKNYGENKPAAVIGVAAPIDLSLLYDDFLNPATRILLQAVTGTTPQDNPAIYKASSPINFVQQGIPPTLIIHGELDNIVPVYQALLMKQKLEATGGAHKTVIYPTAGHNLYGSNIAHAFNEIETFIRQHLN